VRKRILQILQATITLGILWLLLRDPQKRHEMAEILRGARPLWLAAGLLTYGIVELLSAWRWHLLLKVQDIHLPKIRVLQLTMIGVFFNYLVPGGTGGDLVKGFYLLKETTGRSAAALLSVLMDRLLGLFTLILMAGALSLVRWQWLTSTPQTAGYAWIGLGILAASLFALLLSIAATAFGWVNRLPARIPGRRWLMEASMAYALYGRAWKTCTASVLLSVAINVGYFGTFYCANRALQSATAERLSFLDLCSVMPLINAITSLPLSFGGIGVREKLFDEFLTHLCGTSSAIAVLTSSTGYFLTLLWGMAGGAVYLFYRPSTPAAPDPAPANPTE